MKGNVFIIVLLVVALSLLSCRDSNTNSVSQNATVQCIDNISSSNSVNPNDIKIQVLKLTGYQPRVGTPLSNIIVQIDHDGVCVRSDADGYVTFTALSNGEHDIHVFPQNKYQRVSIYNVKIGEVVPVFLGKPNIFNDSKTPVTGTSYLSFSGVINYFDTNSRLKLAFYSDSIVRKNIRISADPNTSTYTAVIEFSVPPGTIISGQLLATEEKINTITNESYISDSTVIDIVNAKSTAQKNSYSNLPINLSNPKLALSTLLSFDRIDLPIGFTARNIQINGGARFSNNTITNPMLTLYYVGGDKGVLPLDITAPYDFLAYEPFGFTELSFRISAFNDVNTRDVRWHRSSRYPANAIGLTITPKIPTTPVFENNQNGEVLRWSGVAQPATDVVITINSTVPGSWNLYAGVNSTSLRLPKIPNGLTPMFFSGTQYDIYFFEAIINGDFLEYYALNNLVWTR